MRITSRKFIIPKEFYLAGVVLGGMSGSYSWAQVPAVEEVMVTAQMREEPIQKTPLSLSSYGKEFVEKIGASSLVDIESAIPSINFGGGERSTRGEIVIRGIGDYARNIGTNARVAVYIDGVLTGRSSSFNQSLLDVTQVEVLRGPQGTLAGTNALAGAINIITDKPGDSLGGELFASVGNYDSASLVGKANVPLTSDLFASVLLGNSDQEGYVKNLTLDRDLQGYSRDTAKFKVRYVGVERLTLDIGLDYLKDEGDSTNAEALANGFFNGFTQAPAAFEVAHDADEFQVNELKGASIQAELETVPGYRWTTITGVRDNKFSELNEEDYSPFDVAISVFDEQTEQVSQEVRLASPKGGVVDYVLGVYLMEQDISTNRSAVAGSLFPNAPNTQAQTPANAGVESSSLYLHGNYHFDSRWSVTAGVRYVNEVKDIDYSSVDTTGLFVNVSHLTDQKTFNEWLPKFGVNFQMTSETLIYTSVARAYKSGGWNADFISTLENFQFDPEYATNYEMGLKTSFLDRRITVDTSAFLTKFDDFQVFQFVPTQSASGTILSLTNAGKVTSQGVELDIGTKLTEYLRLDVNAAFTSAKFDEFKNGGGVGVHYDHHYLPYAPQQSYFVGLDYARPMFRQFEIYAHMDYGYTDDYFSNPNNTPENSIPGRMRTNARLGVNLDSEWDISLWVKNLTDETNLRQRSVSFLGVPRGVYDPPRTFGLELKYHFD